MFSLILVSLLINPISQSENYNDRLFNVFYEYSKVESENYIECVSNYNQPFSKSLQIKEKLKNSMKKACYEQESEIRKKLLSFLSRESSQIIKEVDLYINIIFANQFADIEDMIIPAN